MSRVDVFSPHSVNRNPGVLKISFPFACFLFVRDMVTVVMPTEKIVIPAAMKHVQRPGLQTNIPISIIKTAPYSPPQQKWAHKKEKWGQKLTYNPAHLDRETPTPQ
jgi:hypothetical protein